MTADLHVASKKTSEQEDKEAAYLRRREQVRRAQRYVLMAEFTIFPYNNAAIILIFPQHMIWKEILD
jgi:hypothetical protein